MNFSSVIKLAIVLVVAFSGIEALRVRHADHKLQAHAGAGAVFPAGDGPVQGSPVGKSFEPIFLSYPYIGRRKRRLHAG